MKEQQLSLKIKRQAFLCILDKQDFFFGLQSDKGVVAGWTVTYLRVWICSSLLMYVQGQGQCGQVADTLYVFEGINEGRHMLREGLSEFEFFS